MPSLPSLAAVTGRTENALRALLSKTLAPTHINSYSAWVVLNAQAADTSASHSEWRRAAADALKVGDQFLDPIVAHLRAANLIDSNNAVSAFGQTQLTAARSAVAAATASLVEDISADEQETTRRVLDHIRFRAEALLSG